MGNLGNKEIMANNIKYFMSKKNIRPTDICGTLKIPMPTFSDWINAKTYPRIDKIELMANYFGISKADLVEERSTDSNIPKIMEYYEKLNDIGKHEATKRVAELTYFPQYTQSSVNAAHSIIGATEDDQKHDDDIMDSDDF